MVRSTMHLFIACANSGIVSFLIRTLVCNSDLKTSARFTEAYGIYLLELLLSLHNYGTQNHSFHSKVLEHPTQPTS